jgi:hypothetical protein
MRVLNLTFLAFGFSLAVSRETRYGRRALWS